MAASVNSRCTVAILNYNGEKWLRQFLPGVVARSGEALVLVYDNASSDGSVPYVEAAFPGVALIRGKENLGFCEGYNRAFNHTSTEYTVLLNSDVEVTEGWLDALLAPLEADASVAAVQPKILSYAQRDCFEYAGAGGGYLDRFGYPYCRGRLFETVEKDAHQYDDARDVFWASGACMAVRTELFRNLGGLDVRFFAHMEEIDWCWRAQRAGYRIRYQPTSVVYHVGGGTLEYNSPRKLFLNYRNGLLMLDNNLTSIVWAWTILVRLCLDGLSGLYLALKGNPSAIGTILKAHFAFYALRGTKKRADLPVRVLPGKRVLVWDYFVKGKKRFDEP